MSKQPRFILRNCNLWADRINQVGQASEISLPVPEVKLEEMRNAGMVMPIEVAMGYEKLNSSFKLTSFDPAVISLFGLAVGVVKEYMITGALVHEDGGTINATAEIRAMLTKFDPGTWKPGDVAEAEYEMAVRYYRLEVNGRVIAEMDAFDVSIGGVSQTGGIAAALLL